MDKYIAFLKALYLTPNVFQLWAWLFTVLLILVLFKGTRRLGGMGLIIGVIAMALYFGVTKMMHDFAPKDIAPDDLKAAPTRRRRH